MTTHTPDVKPTNPTAKKHPVAPAAPERTTTPEVQHSVIDPETVPPAEILRLQRSIGNRAATRLIQTKLTVGPAHDQYEQEADQVAEQVMRMPVPAQAAGTVQRAPEEEEEIQAKPLAASITPLVQRTPEEEEVQTKPIVQRAPEEELQMKPLVQRQAEEEELQAKPIVQRVPEEEEEIQTKALVQREPAPEEEEVQTKPIQRAPEEEEEIQTKPQVQRTSAGAGFEVGGEFEQQLATSHGGGSPLSDNIRSFMEPRFGADFSSVRIHTGGEAAQLNRSVSAQAFTHGQDIYLGEGKSDLESAQGKQLLAHELTHVVQQTGAVKPGVQRWSIRSRVKGLPAGHELLTQESLTQAGLTDEKLAELGLTGGSKDIVAGSTWNDLPGMQLLHRVHYGDLQFLHSMASNPLEKAGKTLEKILMWAEFCYKVATGVISPRTALGEVPVAGFAELWEGRFKTWSVSYLFSTTGSDEKAKGLALGSMMHMLQDSFCASHVERVAVKRRGEEVARIKSFHAYPAQDSARHGRADLLAEGGTVQEQIKATAGAEDAVQVGKMVLSYLANGAPWPPVKSYLQTILGLVEPEAGVEGPGKAGPGRSFRKSVHKEYYGMLTTLAPTVRPITQASKVYDEMLLYQSKVLTPNKAKIQKLRELAQVQEVLRLIREWEPSKAETSEKNQLAVEFLRGKMQEDEPAILEEIADIENALKTHQAPVRPRVDTQ